MNIGVVLSNDISQGGGFQQEMSTIKLLYKNKNNYNFCFFTTKKRNLPALKKNGISAKLVYSSVFFKILDFILNLNFIILLRKKTNLLKHTLLDRRLNKHQIDLVYFLSPCEEALFVKNHKFKITVWDLCHRDNVEFPEVAFFNKFESRELFYSKLLPRAFRVITDSEIGAENIISKYNIEKKRVVAIPFLPSESVMNFTFSEKRNYEIVKKYKLEEPYIFYPAQFWPHKNHSYILDGIKALKDNFNLNIKALFCGTDWGNYKFIEEKAKKLEIEQQIYNLGFIEDEEIPYLYKNAVALVMPTYFGPTNIPPLEAFKLGCPVLYSDLPLLKEQVETAAFLMDLKKPKSLAEHIKTITTNKDITEQHIENGLKIVNSISNDKNWKILQNIFDDFSIILKCWKN